MLLNPYRFGPVDPHWDKVVSLLHFDGADGSISFVDRKGLAWSRVGDAQLDTSQSVFGGSSGLFDGVADQISTASNASLNLGSADFTIEGFIRPSTLAGNANIISKVKSLNGAWTIFRIGSALQFYASSNGTSYDIVSALAFGTLNLGEFNYFKVIREGSLFSTGLNGTPGATASSALAIRVNDARLVIAKDDTAGSDIYAGHYDEHRITKGIARPGFAAPVSPFPG